MSVWIDPDGNAAPLNSQELEGIWTQFGKGARIPREQFEKELQHLTWWWLQHGKETDQAKKRPQSAKSRSFKSRAEQIRRIREQLPHNEGREAELEDLLQAARSFPDKPAQMSSPLPPDALARVPGIGTDDELGEMWVEVKQVEVAYSRSVAALKWLEEVYEAAAQAAAEGMTGKGSLPDEADHRFIEALASLFTDLTGKAATRPSHDSKTYKRSGETRYKGAFNDFVCAVMSDLDRRKRTADSISELIRRVLPPTPDSKRKRKSGTNPT